MSLYEKLLCFADKMNVGVYELDLGTNKKCGKYIYGCIFINSKMSETSKAEVLSEELGHYFTTYGDITDQTLIQNIKSEKLARRVGYSLIISAEDLSKKLNSLFYLNIAEIAEEIGVSLPFLKDMIKEYNCSNRNFLKN